MKKTITLLVIAAIFMLSSCGLSVKSDSSCKNTLCEGFWSYEHDGEPLLSKYGNFIFKKDGTVQYCTIGHQTNGTWSLGEVVDVTKKISYRVVNVSMDNSVGLGSGKNFQLQLSAGDKKNHLSIYPAEYYHFNDKGKPIR